MSSINDIVKNLRFRRLNENKINYKELDHEELIKLAQIEDQEAFEELVRQYDPLISKLVRGFFTSVGQGDEEDMRQVADLAFWEAIKSYNASVHKNGFGAYASMIMKRKLSDELRKDSADKRMIHNVAGSLDEPVPGDEDGGSSVGDNVAGGVSAEDEYLGKEGARAIFKFMDENLSDVERDVIRKYIQGYKVSEISEELDMKYKSVENAILRVKNKLAEYMKNSKNESTKIDEASLAFSEEEKKVLSSILSKIDEKRNITESDKKEVNIDDFLEESMSEAEDIAVELTYTNPDSDRHDEILGDLDDIIYDIKALQDDMTDQQYEKSEGIMARIENLKDIEYEGPAEDPYASRGLRRSDFI